MMSKTPHYRRMGVDKTDPILRYTDSQLRRWASKVSSKNLAVLRVPSWSNVHAYSAVDQLSAAQRLLIRPYTDGPDGMVTMAHLLVMCGELTANLRPGMDTIADYFRQVSWEYDRHIDVIKLLGKHPVAKHIRTYGTLYQFVPVDFVTLLEQA